VVTGHRSAELSDALSKHGPYNPFEIYLDKYSGDCEALLDKLEMLSELVEHEESLFRLQLNYSQNEILILNTGLTILSCSIGLGAFLTGAFGMNLDNTITLQDKEYSFPIVVVSSLVAMTLSFLLTFGYYQSKGVLPRIVGSEKTNGAKL
jgi:Mg2+ and Co2+ transporter CorA